MLAQLGPIQFTIAPFNMHGTDRASGADFVEKPVVGARPLLEFVGEANDSFTIVGRLFPKQFGGLTTLSALQSLRAMGVPQFLMRGDGVALGWVAIERVSERAAWLAADGVGQVIEFEISLRSSPAPSPAGYIAALLQIGGALQ